MDKKPKSMILLLLFFMPLISALVTFGISEIPKTAPSKSEITFMNYNIHFGQGMDDLLNLERIAQNILTGDPDIIGLQEVENGRITSQGVDMAFWLAKRLNMNYFFYPAVNDHAFGCALLSKFPIKSACGTQIPSILQERVLIHGVISINSTLDIDVFVTHLGIREENNSAQVDYILDRIGGQPLTKPKVLMGDFNLNYSTEEIKKISNNTIINITNIGEPFYESGDYTFPSYPLNGSNEGVIDHIFATNCSVIDYKIIDRFMPGSVPTAAEFGSDHRPVCALLRFT